MNKKAIFVILLLLFFLLCTFIAIAVVCCGGLFYIGMRELASESQEMKSDVLAGMCESHGDFTAYKYEEWFSDKFKKKYTLAESKELVERAYPSDYDCSRHLPEGVWDMIMEGQSIDITYETSGDVATIEFPSDDEYITMELERESGKTWKVGGFSYTEQY